MKTISLLLDGRLIVEAGDITEFTGDAIVNAANSSLLGGGGVDGAIHRAGGPEILAECKALRADRLKDGLPAGQAVATGAGRLPVRRVIHTVGPIWHGGNYGEEETLASCYRESLETARREKLFTIAFPAISTGVYGYPKVKAAVTTFRAIRDYLAVNDIPKTVSLVFFSEPDAQLFLRAIGELTA